MSNKKLPLFFEGFVGVTVFQKGTETRLSNWRCWWILRNL
jgi:hypothetical protein